MVKAGEGRMTQKATRNIHTHGPSIFGEGGHVYDEKLHQENNFFFIRCDIEQFEEV